MPLNSPLVDAHSSKRHYKDIALHLPLSSEEKSKVNADDEPPAFWWRKNQNSTPTMNVITKRRPPQIQEQIAHRIHPAVNNNRFEWSQGEPHWELYADQWGNTTKHVPQWSILCDSGHQTQYYTTELCGIQQLLLHSQIHLSFWQFVIQGVRGLNQLGITKWL